MEEMIGKESSASELPDVTPVEAPFAIINEAAAIPKGTIDPIYEAKARVLNNAVCLSPYPRHLSVIQG
jgi:hypothetical protein